MRWPSYIPGKSTLLLFKAARGRLMATSENVGSLPNKRIASASEEIDRISDDIRHAKATVRTMRMRRRRHASRSAALAGLFARGGWRLGRDRMQTAAT
jgi:hypothetical protein